jgi:hypothetical protein
MPLMPAFRYVVITPRVFLTICFLFGIAPTRSTYPLREIRAWMIKVAAIRSALSHLGYVGYSKVVLANCLSFVDFV